MRVIDARPAADPPQSSPDAAAEVVTATIAVLLDGVKGGVLSPAKCGELISQASTALHYLGAQCDMAWSGGEEARRTKRERDADLIRSIRAKRRANEVAAKFTPPILPASISADSQVTLDHAR